MAGDDSGHAIVGFGILVAALALGVCLIKGTPVMQTIGWTIVAGVGAMFFAGSLS